MEVAETQLIADNVRAMLQARGLAAEPTPRAEVEAAIDRGALRLEGRDAAGRVALVVLVVVRNSPLAGHAPLMEAFMKRFLAAHGREAPGAPVMLVYERLTHFVAKVLRKLRAAPQAPPIELHRDELFLQRPAPELVPAHSIVADKAPLEARFGVGFEARLSRIYTGDKMAVWIGARAGDVVRVEYVSAATGTQEQFLVAVPGDPMVMQRVQTADNEDLDEADEDLDEAEEEPAEDLLDEELEPEGGADAGPEDALD